MNKTSLKVIFQVSLPWKRDVFWIRNIRTLRPLELIFKVSFTRQSYVQSYVLRIAFSPYELRLSKRQAVHTQRST